MPFLSYCIYKLSIQTAVVDEGGRFDLVPTGTGFGEGGRIPAGKIRKFFPETWIWDLIPVGYVSCTMALLFLCKAVVFVYVYLALGVTYNTLIFNYTETLYIFNSPGNQDPWMLQRLSRTPSLNGQQGLSAHPLSALDWPPTSLSLLSSPSLWALPSLTLLSVRKRSLSKPLYSTTSPNVSW